MRLNNGSYRRVAVAAHDSGHRFVVVAALSVLLTLLFPPRVVLATNSSNGSSSSISVEFNIVDFGADPTGVVLANPALDRAIQAARQQSTMTSSSDSVVPVVIVPPGLFRIRPFQLFSHMTLRLDSGAVLDATQDDVSYILSSRTLGTTTTTTNTNSWPLTKALATFGGGREDGKPLRYEAVIWAEYVTGLRITGHGTIRGGGPLWWTLFQNQQTPWTRPHLIEIRHSNNIVVDGITMEQSPFWTLNIHNTSHTLVEKVRILNPTFVRFNATFGSKAFNIDGVDINSCVNFVLRDSYIDTEDDAVAIKSGLDRAGLRARRPSQNILIANLTLKSATGAGVAIGSELSGGVSNVTVEDCRISETKRAVRFKTFPGRGAVVSNIRIRNITIESLRFNSDSIIQFDMFGGLRAKTSRFRLKDRTTFKDITIDNVVLATPQVAARGILIVGDGLHGRAIWSLLTWWIKQPAYIRNVVFSNFQSGGSTIPVTCSNADNVWLNGKKVVCKKKPFVFLSGVLN
jgi:polygalacturonase